MATSAGRTILRSVVMDACPACKSPIWMEVSVEIRLSPDASIADAASLLADATSEVRGVRIAHDCIPSATRTPGGPRKEGGNNHG